mmetsp:Transcript_12274/g.15791  ORF Transcript_12274/g.15791 Transcript_12274/m.15791 type:complete len:90 (-) Transcript_12274:324-593(-)
MNPSNEKKDNENVETKHNQKVVDTSSKQASENENQTDKKIGSFQSPNEKGNHYSTKTVLIFGSLIAVAAFSLAVLNMKSFDRRKSILFR